MKLTPNSHHGRTGKIKTREKKGKVKSHQKDIRLHFCSTGAESCTKDCAILILHVNTMDFYIKFYSEKMDSTHYALSSFLSLNILFFRNYNCYANLGTHDESCRINFHHV